ncbi:hypothetical protein GH714_042446 [Hevea brasiliensis]|uniref:Uncharacterized protein n=1 Tax=Hevea brasiliensis TaxID=3981 RepID=A0A6A6M8Z7_HEVBR|nr:hypothetical protein GH714_042446 [Hevea brasiliensis]
MAVRGFDVKEETYLLDDGPPPFHGDREEFVQEFQPKDSIQQSFGDDINGANGGNNKGFENGTMVAVVHQVAMIQKKLGMVMNL